MTKPLKKVTTFTGRASGDCECFCFDRRTQMQHDHDETLANQTKWRRQDRARIYPHDLLPETSRAFGEWRITVEFTPTAGPKESTDR